MTATTIDDLTSRMLALDLRGDTTDLARELPALHRQLVAAVGAPEAQRRFDAALRAAVGGHPSGRALPGGPRR